MKEWTERDALAALATLPGVGPASLEHMRGKYGSLARAVAHPLEELANVASAASVGAGEALRRISDLRGHLAIVQDLATEAGAGIVTYADVAWPERLTRLTTDEPASRAPSVLWVRGRLEPMEERFSVAVVGSRRPDPLARAQAEALATGLAAAGISVISGGATGVDGIAHRAALEAGGHTVAVLGTGIDVPYPRRHRGLFEDIVSLGGALVTEYAPGTVAQPGLFPRRNRIISALADMVLVVAATDGSGSLSTADHAANQDRIVAAIPGDPRRKLSGGCNRLLVRGAAAVLDATDVIELLLETFGPERDGGRAAVWLSDRRRSSGGAVAVGAQVPISPAAERLLRGLEAVPRGADILAAGTGLSGAQVAAALAELEVYGLAERVAGGYVLAGHPGIRARHHGLKDA